LLFDLHGRDGTAISDLMARFNQGPVSIEPQRLAEARKLFDSYAVDDELTCATIRQVFEETEEVLDPHTAIGVKAAREGRRDPSIPMITLATAQPVKFPEAVEKSGVGVQPELPPQLAG